MCAKRGALLTELAGALNPAVYGGVVGELAWGGALAWLEAADCAAEGGGGAAAGEAAGEAALGALTVYLRGFEDPRWPGQPLGLAGCAAPAFAGAGPVVGVEAEETFAMAHFLCGRVLFRRRGAAQACLARVTWFLTHLLPALGAPARERLAPCAEICRQLATLLPQKIAAGL